MKLSIVDVSWLLFIASNDLILAILWFFIASVQMRRILRNGLDTANNLASLGRDNDYNKKMIVKEGGVVPLLKLLKERVSPNAQMATSTTIFYLVNDQDTVRSIACELAVPLIVKVLADSPIKVNVLATKMPFVHKRRKFPLVSLTKSTTMTTTRKRQEIRRFDTFLQCFGTCST
ncbi:hypothetical protein LOK49_LG11G02649 [Camellia lanceoleosa]|uniref:Uncharacterized protein n=1 Tax=Camellia lanceoleosa TaxID=1840588 RepID=A0ACC0G5P8_9ERIC|nr:hypothetical protein LOK49_LG11G02649 [Camellia lanceoleosa]